MEKKFKVGDRVKVINNSHFNPKVKVGDVAIITDDYYTLEFVNCEQLVNSKIADQYIRKIDDKLIFRDNATILIKDGKKYIAKCCDGDTYDKEKGLLVCLAKAHGYTFNDLQEMLKGAEAQSKKQDCKAEKSKFEIGDFVKVINLEKRYRTYEYWFDIYAQKFKNKFANAIVEINKDTTYKIVAKGKHDTFKADGMLYAIEDQQGVVFLIGEKGIKKAEFKEVNRNAKVGEYIKIVNAVWTGEKYKKGDILKVKEIKDDGHVRTYYNGVGNTEGIGYNFIYRHEYVVLENYKPKGANNGN